MNLVVVGFGFYEILARPQTAYDWRDALFTDYGNPLLI